MHKDASTDGQMDGRMLCYADHYIPQTYRAGDIKRDIAV